MGNTGKQVKIKKVNALILNIDRKFNVIILKIKYSLWTKNSQPVSRSFVSCYFDWYLYTEDKLSVRELKDLTISYTIYQIVTIEWHSESFKQILQPFSSKKKQTPRSYNLAFKVSNNWILEKYTLSLWIALLLLVSDE